MEVPITVECTNALGLVGSMMNSSESWILYPLRIAYSLVYKSFLAFFRRRVEHSMMPKSLYKQKVAGKIVPEMFPQS